MISIEVLCIDQTDRLEQIVTIAKTQLSSAVTIDLLCSALNSPTTTIFVALHKEEDEKETKVIGTATLGILHCISGIRGHIEDVVVDASWRGKGVGKLLLEKAIVTAVQHYKVRTLDLTSRPDRVAANGLYKKMGFIQRDTNVYRYQPSSST